MHKNFRKKYAKIPVLLVIAGALTACAAPIKQEQGNQNTTPANFTDQQKQQISAIVQDTILNNPEILVEAVNKLHQQQLQATQQQAISNILGNTDKLLNDDASPTIGPNSAKVVVIEFMDYQCVYCHQDYPVVKTLMAAHPEVKFVFKEFPIFGPASQYAAQMSLAAYQQGKFIDFHNALFATGKMEGQLSDKDVDQVAQSVGVNLKVAKDYIQTPAIAQEISNTQSLATSLGIQGTPDFIIMPNSVNPDPTKITFLPGAVPGQTLEQAIAQAQS